MLSLDERLRQSGVQPSAQRLAIAAYVLDTGDHPSADEVWQRVKKTLPMVSRATVYNTLNLFVGKGLLRQVEVGGGRVLFDPRTEPHHHLIDDRTGKVYDVPWEALDVQNIEQLGDFEVDTYEVVLRGRRRDSARQAASRPSGAKRSTTSQRRSSSGRRSSS